MQGFCPRCGKDAEVVNLQEGRYKGDTKKMRVTRCHGCGCRTSWYPDGAVRIWSHGDRMDDVPEGKMIVSPGVEE